MGRFLLRCFPYLLILITAAYSQAAAEEAFVVDVVRSEPFDRVYISASIKGAFSREIISTIESGATVTFTYFVQLKRHRAVFWDETSRRLAIKRMVKYDTLKKEHLTWEKRGKDAGGIDFKAELAALDYGKKGEDQAQPEAAPPREKGEPALEPVPLKSIKDLERWMTNLEKIDLGPADGLRPGTRYYARVRAEMKSIKLIPPFNYILFFLSFWDFDTGWGSSTPFTINPAPAPEKAVEKTNGG